MVYEPGHSIIISGKNLYSEWGLIPSERPVVAPPPIKSTFVEIPGCSESIDYTEILRNRVSYGQRTGSWKFYLDPDWPGSSFGDKLRKKNNGTLWATLYGSLINYINGRRHTIVLEDTPNTTYTGRLTLSEWKSGNNFSEITINYNIDPPARN